MGCVPFSKPLFNISLVNINGSRRYFDSSRVVVTGDFHCNTQSIQLTCFIFLFHDPVLVDHIDNVYINKVYVYMLIT